MGKITYNRNTTYSLGVIYTNTNGVLGSKALFTVKPTQYDSDALDATSILLKDITLTANTGSTTINPTDLDDTILPGTYYYDFKVLDTSGAIYMIDSGKFVLVANPTNRES